MAASLSAFSAFSASHPPLVAAPRSGCCSRSLVSSAHRFGHRLETEFGPRSVIRRPRTALMRASGVQGSHMRGTPLGLPSNVSWDTNTGSVPAWGALRRCPTPPTRTEGWRGCLEGISGPANLSSVSVSRFTLPRTQARQAAAYTRYACPNKCEPHARSEPQPVWNPSQLSSASAQPQLCALRDGA